MLASEFFTEYEQRYAATSPALTMHYGMKVRELSHEEASRLAEMDAPEHPKGACAVCGSEHLSGGRTRCWRCVKAKRYRMLRCVVCGDPYTATTRTRFCPSCQPTTGHQYAVYNMMKGTL